MWVQRHAGGEGGIRTHEPLAGLHAFQACLIGLSSTLRSIEFSGSPRLGRERCRRRLSVKRRLYYELSVLVLINTPFIVLALLQGLIHCEAISKMLLTKRRY